MGISVDLATYLSIPIAIVIASCLVDGVNFKSAATILCCSLVGILFSIILWQSRYFGMPALGGADAANHVLMQADFVSLNPQAYTGFTALYGISSWLERLGIGDTFECYRAIVYAVPPIFFILVGFAAVSFFGSCGLQTIGFCFLLTVTSWLALVPRFHYFQCDGFLANLLAPLPMAFIWLSWSVGRTTFNRICLCLLGLALLRYTYGLNLGDVALTLALVCLLEPISKVWRYGLFLAFSLAAIYCYLLLSPVIWQSSGGIQPYGVTRDAVAISLLSFILLLLAPPQDKIELRRSSAFCGIFGLVSSSAALLYQLTTPSPQYYVFKYLFVSAFILSTVTLLHICIVVPKFARSNPTRMLLFCCCFGLSIWMQNRALSPYKRSLSERIAYQSRPRLLLPLLDRSVLSAIQATLKNEGKEFGGYITGSWPQAAFLNALQKSPLDLATYRSGELNLQQGHCFFWNAAPSTPTALRARGAESAAGKVLIWNSDQISRFIESSDNHKIGYQCS